MLKNNSLFDPVLKRSKKIHPSTILTYLCQADRIRRTMSQDLLIKMVSVGDENGVGKGHVYYTRYNNKNKKDPSKKYETKKYNPVAKTHTVYKQKK